MAKHITVGKLGESLAVKYFQEKSYEILHHNWRQGNWEVDIIAKKNEVLHFIEVKTKTTDKYGYPEEEVSISKIKFLISAAECYVHLYPQWERIQFDVLAIVLKPALSFFLIEDIYL